MTNLHCSIFNELYVHVLQMYQVDKNPADRNGQQGLVLLGLSINIYTNMGYIKMFE